MDTQKIKKELQAIVGKHFPIYWAITVEYDTNILKNPNKTLQEVLKDPLKSISKEIMEKALNESLENLSKEELQKKSKTILQKVLKEFVKENKHPKQEYYNWYHKACKAVRIFAPERLEEFEKLYTGSKNTTKAEDLDSMTAGTSHYVQGWAIEKNGNRIDFFDTFKACFNAQNSILSAILENFDNPLFTLENDIRNGIYESELDIAKDIQNQGHLKIAGAVAGVIIEAHLKTLVTKKDLPIKTEKNKPLTMSNYNDALKGNTYDTATWRQIQTCGDIRNLCVHPRESEPTKYQIDTIISTAEIIITIYN